MNCQEVMELMQRHIDGDLHSSEKDDMNRHLVQCPACQTMFERLERLSSELEQLPKVVPPFSIVDSILPRLDALDSASVEAPAEVTGTPQAKTAARRKRMAAWNWPALGGVVAAGLMIGLFMVTNPPGGSQSNKADNAAADTASTAEAPETMMRKQSAADGSAAGQENSPASDEPAAQMDQFKAEADKSASPDTPVSSDSGGAPDQYTDSGTNPNGGNQVPGYAGADGGVDLKDGVRADVTSPNAPAPSRNGAGSGGKTGSTSVEDTPAGSNGDADQGKVPAAEGSPGQSGFGGKHSITADSSAGEPEAGVTQHYTKDGAYSAYVTAKSEVIIYDHIKHKPIFISSPKAGAIANLIWSDDEMTVSYDVLGKNVNESYAVEVGTWKENKK
ncbi:zf-HC2 domain-containing protein [Paenibacillus gansuensis]|uniref:Anti-sigma-W factor RsiW n=1 Tax=Paenibacillus gansuensis TaxID=306542 RepID=A0ABW5PCG5_9BACL